MKRIYIHILPLWEYPSLDICATSSLRTPFPVTFCVCHHINITVVSDKRKHHEVAFYIMQSKSNTFRATEKCIDYFVPMVKKLLIFNAKKGYFPVNLKCQKITICRAKYELECLLLNLKNIHSL